MIVSQDNPLLRSPLAVLHTYLVMHMDVILIPAFGSKTITLFTLTKLIIQYKLMTMR